MDKIKSWLNSPENGSALAIFRIIFGLLMAYQTYFYHSSGLVTKGFTNPKMLFHYDWLEFIQPLPVPILNVFLVIMGVAALAIAAGMFFRIAAIVHITIHLYFLLIDKSIFNNHIYFFILLGFLLAFTNADRFLSVGGNRGFGDKVPRWQYFILQSQIAILYIYGAFAKITIDWFVHFEPLKAMLAAIPDSQGGWAIFLKHNASPVFFAIGGFLYDLLVPFLLWWRKTRYWAILPTLFFHFSNSTIFNDIGIFPYFSIFCSILFFSEINFSKLRSTQIIVANTNPQNRPFRNFEKVLIGFFIFQLLFPLRWLVLPNNPDYTFIANHFSWRMKSHSRFITKSSFEIEDGASGKKYEVKTETYLNTMQIKRLGMDATASVKFAKFIAEESMKNFGIRSPIVRADIRILYNGRREQSFIDPKVDLSKVEYSPFKKAYWVMPIVDY